MSSRPFCFERNIAELIELFEYMKNEPPKISIITAAFDCAEFIEETYDSIASQSISNWEWIVVDDSSGDDTLKVLDKLSVRDARLRILNNEQNSGAAYSRNRGLDEAKGELIAFIDSDDLWAPDKLEKQLEFMAADKDFTFTGYQIVDEKGQSTGKEIDVNSGGPFFYRDMLAKRATLGCSTVMVRRSTIGNLRMPPLRTAQDYAFWLRLLKQGIGAHLLPLPLTSYRLRANSLSRNKFRKAKQQWRIYRDVERLPLFRSIAYFVSYAWRATTR